MDKQKTKYIRITKQPDGANDWYRDYYRAKPIFEVRELPHNKHYYDVIGTNYLIAKEDCEPYEFPQAETMEDREKTWEQYKTIKGACEYFMQHEYVNIPFCTTPKGLAKKAFEAGAIWGLEQTPVQEGHTITEEQLKDLYESLGEYSPEAGRELLANIFPTVFKPERTYQSGDKLSFDGQSYAIVPIDATTASLITLDFKYNWDGTFTVSNIDNITEKELREHIGGPFEFIE